MTGPVSTDPQVLDGTITIPGAPDPRYGRSAPLRYTPSGVAAIWRGAQS